ncbi:low-specificity L-threonine aldolase [Neobacillus notoginsengisoli]|uniref:Low-specificity L-threonine aldolase n=1 Tax=Neobacillus notoginsengisoli TaxID=1578198 RepID=A0A417YXH4_9BACI|nr:low-specificity L-threonine aldolase [Neobacillus notoginsengisoli]RHW42200.1 low-specificity L-threonine aldolase [Neobacillus notoginsengisoli]
MIDLRSDTVTKPTEEMRMAAYKAEVGDDVYGEDPTVRKLEETAASLLGKEDALFVTSGTQGNQIAILVHCTPGQEVILEEESHIFYYESAAASALASVQTRTIPGIRGRMDPGKVERAIRGEDIHYPETGLICIENTHNRAGGAIIPLTNMNEIHTLANKNNIPVHIDGARLFNASIALGVPVSELAKYSESVQICLSKGLGAPVGSLLAGNKAFIRRARKWRKRLGGGMRQAGVIAAPGLIALTKMPGRLGEDHENAKRLAEGASNIQGLSVVNKVETNIVVIDISGTGMDEYQFVERLKERGILGGTFGEGLVRLVTNYDVSRDDIDSAVSHLHKIARDES